MKLIQHNKCTINWADLPSNKCRKPKLFCPGHLMCDYYVKSILSTLHFPNVISINWFNRTGFCSNATGPDCVLDLVRPSVLIITSAPESLFFTQTHCGWLSVATAPAFGRLWLRSSRSRERCSQIRDHYSSTTPCLAGQLRRLCYFNFSANCRTLIFSCRWKCTRNNVSDSVEKLEQYCLSLSLSVVFDFRGLMLSPVYRLLILTLAVMCM